MESEQKENVFAIKVTKLVWYHKKISLLARKRGKTRHYGTFTPGIGEMTKTKLLTWIFGFE